MWYKHKILRDVVILDPVDFFVKPVTHVICDPELHCKAAHDHCSLHYPDNYRCMKEHGLVSHSLLVTLLGFGGNYDNCEALTMLCTISLHTRGMGR
jgi:hypothetical protein